MAIVAVGAKRYWRRSEPHQRARVGDGWYRDRVRECTLPTPPAFSSFKSSPPSVFRSLSLVCSESYRHYSCRRQCAIYVDAGIAFFSFRYDMQDKNASRRYKMFGGMHWEMCGTRPASNVAVDGTAWPPCKDLGALYEIPSHRLSVHSEGPDGLVGWCHAPHTSSLGVCVQPISGPLWPVSESLASHCAVYADVRTFR